MHVWPLNTKSNTQITWPNKEEKGIQSYFLFQNKIKSKLIKTRNGTDYF